MKQHRLQESRCLGCGKLLDCASCLQHDDAPGPGDVTICLDCGHIMIFTDDMGLRNPNFAEIHDLAGDADVLLIQRLRKETEKDE